jgi:hypothetical protein
MRTLSLFVACLAFILPGVMKAQDRSATQLGKNIRIQKIVHDVIGKTVRLNFKEGTPREGTLTRANGGEFVLEIEGVEEKYPTQTIRSLTLSPGIAEGILVVVSSALVAGFGLGAVTLAFDGATSGAQAVVAIVFGIFGGWLGYESFFQEVEIELP